MKTKDSYEITNLLYNKVILDMDGYSDDVDSMQPSEYLFFVKDVSYEGELTNKLALVILSKDNGYVVNNNFRFNSIEIIGNKIIIYVMVNNKRQEHYYWFKDGSK